MPDSIRHPQIFYAPAGAQSPAGGEAPCDPGRRRSARRRCTMDPASRRRAKPERLVRGDE